MPTVPLRNDQLQDAVDAVHKYGGVEKAAASLGVGRWTIDNRYRKGKLKGLVPTAPKAEFCKGAGKRIMVIPDLHTPFQHPDAVAFLKEVKEHYQPQSVICLGDEVDNHALSQYDPDPDGYSAGHELQRAIEELQPLYELFPLMSVMESNHGVRGFKKAYRAGIPAAFLKEYRDYMQSPKGWHWYPQVEIDGVIYKHGDGYSGKDAALNAAKDAMKSTVIGHIHAFAGIQYYNNGDSQIFGMNCGCLADLKSYAMKYAQHNRSKPILACGIVDKGLPTLIAMRLDSNRRWTGKL